MEEIFILGREFTLHNKEWFNKNIKIKDSVYYKSDEHMIEGNIYWWSPTPENMEELYGIEMVITEIWYDYFTAILKSDITKPYKDQKEYQISPDFIDINKIKKPYIPTKLVKLRKDLITKYPYISGNDRGSGGQNVRNYESELYVKYCIEDVKYGLLIPDGCTSHNFPDSEIQAIIDGTSDELFYEFQATKHTHIERTITFYEDKTKLPKEFSKSWY